MEGTRSGPVSGTILHFPRRIEKDNKSSRASDSKILLIMTFLGMGYFCKWCNSCCSISINNLKQIVEGCLNDVQYSTLKYADWAEFGFAASL